MMAFGSLFAGIGGLDLGFERAGVKCAWQVEIDDYATRVLAKHWPDVPRWRDIRTFPPEPIDVWRCDIITAGFPCQDISFAGKGAGLAGERSGLFFEAVRVVRQLRPRYIVLENVAALLVRGLDVVLGTLAEIGYDAEWHCIPAAAVGAPHIRDRVFVVAYANSERLERAEHERQRVGIMQRPGNACEDMADADITRPQGRPIIGSNARAELAAFERGNRESGGHWATEPNVGRVAYGVSARVDRLRGLGNAVVPQVAEVIGRCIIEHDTKRI